MTVFVLVLAGPVWARIIYVDPNGSADFTSIQAAIDDPCTVDDDEIEVGPGTYYEAINFNGKAVRLYSSGGASVTTINGTGHYHVVQCVYGEDANTILEGFTITGGNANSPELIDRYGGGMYNCGSSPTVIGCVFCGNYTGDGSNSLFEGEPGGDGGDGAGMYNYYASPTVTECTFSQNVTGKGGQGGVGVDVDVDGSNGGNGGNGAGMYNYNSSTTVTYCTFRENATGKGGNGGTSVYEDGGGGGNSGSGAGMYNHNSSPTVTECTFSENTTGNGGRGAFSPTGRSGDGGKSGSGAGISNTEGSSPVVTGCKFTKNLTGNGGKSDGSGGIESLLFLEDLVESGGCGGSSGSGAGMSNTGGSSPTVRDCKFTENKCGNGGNGGIGGSIYTLPFIETKLYAGDGGNGGDGGQGAGMYNSGSSPIVTECTFTGNQGGSGGPGGQGGYTLTRKFPWIRITEPFSIVIIYCESYPGDGGMGGIGGDGGGICSRDSSPAVTNCSFIANKSGNGGNGGAGGVPLLQPKQKATGGNGGNGGDGAGICYLDCSASDVNDCAFSDNEAGAGGLAGTGTFLWVIKWQSTGSPGSGGDGGGIGVHQSLPIVTNCTFAGNSAWYGGGMYNDSNSTSDSPTVTNCTFTLNLGKISGGGIYSSYSSGSPTVTNCIFWDDEVGEIGGSANVTYCDVEGGYAGTGNIDAPPAFADDAWRLPLGSICIDAGSNSAPNLPARDFDGWPRIMGTAVDMGAFEYTADLRIRNATKDILYGSIQATIDDANDGDEIFVLPGTYSSAIDFKGKAVRLYSTSGPQFTTIDGTSNFHVVQCVSGEDSNTILEGFTITDGNANGSSAPDNCGGGMLNSGSSPTVINCIFTGNAATGGGGMDNENSSSPTLTNCTFVSNITSGGGGGLRNADSSHPTVTNCTFESNTASTHGGGMVNVLSSSPTITNCTFSGNTASGLGGGIINSVGCSPTIVNCIFGSNQAENGGGMFNNDNSHPIVTNCNFLYNSASVAGGGMCNSNNSNPIVTNCIFWDDYAPDEISNISSSPVVTYCDVNIPSGTYPGTGNINANPGFSGAIIAGRPECSEYLSSSASPCADAGDNNAPNLPGTDMGGQPRVIDGDVDGNSTVDMGAYELQPCVKNVTRNRWYQLIQHSIEDACDSDTIEVPPGTYYESVDFMNAPNNFILTSIDPNDPNIVKQTIIDAKFGGHVLTFTSQGSSCVLAGFTLTISGDPLMVPGFGYGIGSYGQITSPTIRNCNITNTRGVRFDYGSPALSGCTIKDNYGGLTVSNGSVVEDCIIANNLAIEGNGLYCAVETGWGNTTLRRCIVSGNLCEYTAISCGDNTTIQDCVISDNTGMMGAVWSSSSPSAGKMSGCTISNNKGSGINGWAGPIENCIITGNAGQDVGAIMSGGGINNCTGSITGSIISGNKAMHGGGLGFCSGSIANCVITGNHGIYGGGVSYCDSGAISNCTILGNVAWSDISPDQGQGGGLWNYHGTISNCIIRQNWAKAEENQLYSCSDPNYSCIEGWAGGGTGNITADPCFAYPGYWADANDPNTVVAPDDPNAVWVDGFYRLKFASPCIDAGDNGSVPGGITTDFGGLPRFIDTCTADTGSGTAPLVDMGAYEFLPADIDGSGSVNLRDYSVLAAIWLQTSCEFTYGADFTCDGNVDWNDLQVLTDWWLAGI
jgi:parallel beta-helix repeat protein